MSKGNYGNDNRTDIEKLISDLVRGQKGGTGSSTIGATYIERSERTDLSNDEKALNSIAQLLNLGMKSQVVAIYQDTDALIISESSAEQNTNSQQRMNNVFSVFKDLANLNISTEDQKRIDQSLQNIKIECVRNFLSKESGNNTMERGGNQRQKSDVLLRYLDKNLRKMDRNNDTYSIYLDLAIALNKREYQSIAEITEHLFHSGKIDILQKMDENLVTSLENICRPAQDIERAKAYVLNHRNLFRNNFVFAKQNDNIPGYHAEMKLIDYLYDQKMENGHLKYIDGNERYIATSKLCCAGCHYAIETEKLINPNFKVKVSGTHAKFHSPWKEPYFVSNDEDTKKNLYSQLQTLHRNGININIENIIHPTEERTLTPIQQRNESYISPYSDEQRKDALKNLNSQRSNQYQGESSSQQQYNRNNNNNLNNTRYNEGGGGTSSGNYSRDGREYNDNNTNRNNNSSQRFIPHSPTTTPPRSPSQEYKNSPIGEGSSSSSYSMQSDTNTSQVQNLGKRKKRENEESTKQERKKARTDSSNMPTDTTSSSINQSNNRYVQNLGANLTAASMAQVQNLGADLTAAGMAQAPTSSINVQNSNVTVNTGRVSNSATTNRTSNIPPSTTESFMTLRRNSQGGGRGRGGSSS